MTVTCRIALVVALGTGAPRPARADHHGMAMGDDTHEPTSDFTAGVSLLAARYDTMFYAGDYQAIVPTLGWSYDRYAASASLGLYRLEENGLLVYGIGDAVVQVGARVLDLAPCHAQVALGVSAPTANEVNGLGMGHVMVMPATSATCGAGRLAATVSVGYGRALVDLGAHVHGAWPLVEPMNLSELSWGGGIAYAFPGALRAIGRIGGGVPIAAPGVDRVVGAVRLEWGTTGVRTGAELQLGLVGDPFTLRAVIDTALSF